MGITEEELKKIKGMKRMGYIFPILFIAFLLLGDLFYTTMPEGIEQWDLFLLINAGVLIISMLVNYFMNRKYNLDLSEKTKTIKVETVERKMDLTSYEAGSGTLYIPILGDLFPKLWGQAMKRHYLMYLVINNVRHEVSRETYFSIKKGDDVEMHYAKYSNLLLSIRKSNRADL